MNWMEETARKEAERDKLRDVDVLGEVIAIVALSVLITFLVANQSRPTGLFTSEFGTVEMVALYGCLFYGYLPPLLRILLRRRNVVRPFEVIGNGLFIVAASYLLYVFPFDFTQLSVLLPEGLSAVFDWLTDDVAKLILSIAIAVTVFVSVWQIVLFHLVKDRIGGKEA